MCPQALPPSGKAHSQKIWSEVMYEGTQGQATFPGGCEVFYLDAMIICCISLTPAKQLLIGSVGIWRRMDEG